MIKNMGAIDRTVRVLAALVIGLLIINGGITGVWAIVLGVFAVIFLATSTVSSCPLYYPFRFSTRNKEQAPKHGTAN